MAFKMNRPVIKGTKSHKESVLKAKAKDTKPIVEMTRTKADAGLLSASEKYGESMMPKEVDFTTRYQPKITKAERKKKKEQTYDEYLSSGQAHDDYWASEEGKARLKKQKKEKALKLDQTTSESEAEEMNLEKAGKTPPPHEVTMAEDNPEYRDYYMKENPEFGSVKTYTGDKKYNFEKGMKDGVITEQWTYNGHPITESEVPDERYADMYIPDSDIANLVVHPSVVTETKGSDNEITRGNKPPKNIDRSLTKSPKPKPWEFKSVQSYNDARKAWYDANPTGEDNIGVDGKARRDDYNKNKKPGESQWQYNIRKRKEKNRERP